ncbi:VWA domain-containing protein [Blastopirellula marina]|uniref:VWA domain-containing protein n=1 Tax=Blastopirellula marina TaxID=124 RepID=UPI001304B54E|nr:VWA domain-containing protein [Blastopirellula marina]
MERPWFLILLLFLPILWSVSWTSLTVSGRWRWALANGLRTLLCLLVILALAEVELVRKTDRLTVIYLVDRSLSIPPDRLDEVVDYVRSTANTFRESSPDDRVGVITFGGDAAIEIPPWSSDLFLRSQFEANVDRQQTNLEAAMKLAQAAFPIDAAKRVVIVTDGKETLGNAMQTARAMAQSGIGIDVVPVSTYAQGEITVEKITTPSTMREKTPFHVQVVLKNEPGDHWDKKTANKPVPGNIRVIRSGGGRETVVVDQPIALEPGTRVFAFQDELPNGGFYTYDATFTPDKRGSDGFAQNNRASSFTHIESSGQILLIVDAARPTEFDELVAMLERNHLNVTVQPSNQLFTSLSDLQQYDLVILGNVARSTGDTNGITAFSDAQMQLLADNTRNLGAGLIMLGGPDSFGAGGWANTPVEEAMPLDFQIKDAKVVPVGALMLVMDKSGSMAGEKIHWCKAAAREALRALGPRDYIGVTSFDSVSTRTVPLQRAENRQFVHQMISRLGADGGTNMFPAMEDGFRQLEANDAAVKHMIVLTDGQTPAADFARLTRQISDRGITVTSVAVGQDADVRLLNQIAAMGRGKFYQVTSPKAIPRIFMQEARRVARPLIYEKESGIQPYLAGDHEILKGLPSGFLPVKGYVMTTPKDSPLVDIPLMLPEPVGQSNALMATWQYGIGRSVCWTSDAGQRWTTDWTGWDGFEKLFLQMVRWSMRTTGNDSNYLIATEVRGQKVKVTLNALDDEGNFVNFSSPQLHGVGPQSETINEAFQQVAPGRYEAEFEAAKAGPHFIAVAPNPGQSPLRIGINVQNTQEFRDHADQLPMLEQLAALVPPGGKPGVMFNLDMTPEQLAEIETTPFRHDLPQASSQQPIWYLILVSSACLFLVDIANRRVLWGFAWTRTLWNRMLQRAPQEASQPKSLERLKAQKQSLNRQWSDEFAGDAAEISDEPVREAIVTAEAVSAPPREKLQLDTQEEQGYLDRLLHAKRQTRQADGSDKNEQRN